MLNNCTIQLQHAYLYADLCTNIYLISKCNRIQKKERKKDRKGKENFETSRFLFMMLNAAEMETFIQTH